MKKQLYVVMAFLAIMMMPGFHAWGRGNPIPGNLFKKTVLCRDRDGDGKWDDRAVINSKNFDNDEAYEKAIADFIAAGFVHCDELAVRDECPDNALAWRLVNVFIDQDGDGHCEGTTQICVGDFIPNGFTLDCKSRADCAPNDPNRWRQGCLMPVNCVPPRPCPNISACVGENPPPGYKFCGGGGGGTVELFHYTINPNPARGQLNIIPGANRMGLVEISLVDPWGRVSNYSLKNSFIQGQRISINISGLKPGIYGLTLKSGTMIETRLVGVNL